MQFNALTYNLIIRDVLQKIRSFDFSADIKMSAADKTKRLTMIIYVFYAMASADTPNLLAFPSRPLGTIFTVCSPALSKLLSSAHST